MKSLLLILPMLALGAIGCNTPPKSRVASTPDAPRTTAFAVRNNSYSLLYDLVGDERHVSKVLIIKRDSPELKTLIKEISETSSAAAKALEEFAKQDPSLTLRALELPPGEVATREAIADTKTKELLVASGEEFERALLLTQISALNYGAHLAKVAAANDASPERTAWLHNFEQNYDRYQKRCVELIKTPSLSTAATQSRQQ